jgi:ADP-ribosylglycohydrolase
MLPEKDPCWQRLQMTAGHGVDLRDRFCGALIGGAIGDAMGRANEGVSAGEARARRIREYQSWGKWSAGPKGTITDDTQMTM